MHCKICTDFPDIVKLHFSRVPAICTSAGAVFRQLLIKDHETSDCHKACCKRQNQLAAAAEGRKHDSETNLEKQFRFANTELETKVSKLMLQVYMDAKRGTLSAWSFPARYVAIARILAAKPHSCDVERLVSAYNILKDDDRCSLASDTVDAYLHAHVNMPILSEFDVRPAVRAWFEKAKRRSHTSKKACQQPWFSDVFSKAT